LDFYRNVSCIRVTVWVRYTSRQYAATITHINRWRFNEDGTPITACPRCTKEAISKTIGYRWHVDFFAGRNDEIRSTTCAEGAATDLATVSQCQTSHVNMKTAAAPLPTVLYSYLGRVHQF